MYLSALPLDEVKLFLKIDDEQNETDEEIVNMINASLQFIEKRTNIIMFARNHTYYGCNFVNVYDYPINTADAGQKRNTYTIVPTIDGEVTLNVGYLSSLDIPSDLKQAALQMIKVWFYESEKQINTSLIPTNVIEVIDANKRFIV